MRHARSLLSLVPFVLACNPEFSNRFSHIDGARVLGVQSTAAEVTPKTVVSYRILVATPTGTDQSPLVDWAYCTQPRAGSDVNDFSAACLGSSDVVVPFGSGSEPSGTIPQNACRQFGPDIPQTKPGEPQARPTDADSTGGYYQPVVLNLHAASGLIQELGETRISCGLANSSTAQLTDYHDRSKPNENPELSDVVALELGNASLTAEDAAAPLEIAPGTVLTLRASWPACPVTSSCGDGICGPHEDIQGCPADCSTPHGCQGAEPYAYLDPLSHQIVDRHETIRVSWFSTAGDFADDHTGRTEQEFALTTSDDSWTAPSAQGSVFMWVVLRDARGGIDWKSFRLEVK